MTPPVTPPGSAGGKTDPKIPPPTGYRRWSMWIWVAAIGAIYAISLLFADVHHTESYSELESQLTSGQIAKISIADNGGVDVTLKSGKVYSSRIPTVLDQTTLTDQLRSKGVAITATGGSSSWWPVIGGLLPFALIGGIFWWTARRAGGAFGALGGFGRSKAKIIEAERPATRFDDVAGYQGVKEEIGEIVDFLRNPERYAAVGAKGPRGVIMVGPPGTGKTLLARAVAGQAEVPFLSVTGSAFVEMFVGVGASRVRDLFTEARNRAPSIVFIDEIDAIGGRRGVGMAGGNDEREQTLNQLLAEMDGFDQSSGIVVLAATNRPETLDPALLRPGRFDRQVVVPLPNASERTEILAVHARSKHLAPEIDLVVLARATPGFSGADLANLLNEAAINALRAGRKVVEPADVDQARERLVIGRRDASNALLPDERRAVAVHESGHALIAALCANADPVAKVTILPAGQALGVTEQLPEAERRLYSEDYLRDLLAVRLGGRAAELVVFGQGSTGAANDLAGATAVALRMVTEFGLSPALGPVGYGSGDPNYLGAPGVSAMTRSYSEQTQRVIDREVARLVREAEVRAVGLLRGHRRALDSLAEQLQLQEALDGAVVLRILTESDDSADRRRSPSVPHPNYHVDLERLS